MKRFGRRPKIGDVFSGGGSIPLKLQDLEQMYDRSNPVASLLTWSSLNIAGASDEEIAELKEFQERVYNEVDRIVTELKIEHNEKGHRQILIFTVWKPYVQNVGDLVSSWVIGRGTKTIAILEDNG